jgi:5-(carboxyamino)imidazole ribonucleotide mutase
MPSGVPVGTLAIGDSGARNAALLAIRILAGSKPELKAKLHEFHDAQTERVMEEKLP